MGDALITEYMKSFDTAALKPLICADTQPFTCLFEGNHMDSCRAVLEAGKGFGIAIPMSVAELTSECGSGNTNTSTMHLDAPAVVHKDSQPGVKDDSNTTSTTIIATTTGSHTSAATAGRCMWAAVAASLLALGIANVRSVA